MRISLNLATRPFVELRPFFLRLRIIMAALALVAIGLIIGIHVVQKRLNDAASQMNALKARTAIARNEKLGNEKRMSQPANAAVLQRARFLNQLFLTKSFSWTAVMMDLENVLPSGVQVTAIEPQPTADGNVVIRLRVGGDRDRAVQLVRNLERSKRFLTPKLTGESSQAKDTGQQTQVAANAPPAGVEFDILATYNPLPEGEPFPKEKAPRQEGTEAPAHTASPKRAVVAVRTGTPPNGKYPRDGVVLKPYSGAGLPPRGGTR